MLSQSGKLKHMTTFLRRDNQGNTKIIDLETVYKELERFYYKRQIDSAPRGTRLVTGTYDYIKQ